MLPIFIVPLVVERKNQVSSRCSKASHATSHATHTVANKASDVKDYFGDKNKSSIISANSKIAKENDLNILRKRVKIS